MRRFTYRALLLTGLLALAAGCRGGGPSEASAASPPPPQRPAVADPADWCAGQKLPQSMCTQCNPELIPRFKAAGDWCVEHATPESVCPQCNPLSPPEGAPSTGAAGCGESAAPGLCAPTP